MKAPRTAFVATSAERVFHREGGFTLLEVLVALGILTISSMAILPLLWKSMDQNKTAHLQGKAKEVAIRKMEELASLPEEVIEKYLGSSTTYTSPVEYVAENGAVTGDKSALFQRTFNISQVPGVTVYPKPVVFTCVVQYAYRGKARSCSFTTIGSF